MQFPMWASISLFVVVASQNVLAQSYTIYGPGATSCGDFTKSKGDLRDVYKIWLEGYVTGVDSHQSVFQLLILALARQDMPENGTERRAYCDRTPDDPVCLVWRRVEQGEKIPPQLRATTPNGLLVWIERYCAEHPLVNFDKAAFQLVTELMPTSDTSVASRSSQAESPTPSAVPTIVGQQRFKTNLPETFVLLTQTTASMRLELLGSLQVVVDLRLVGADWVGRTDKSPNCVGASTWRLHQAERLVLNQSCVDGNINGDRGLTLVLTRDSDR